jgi:dienelactone hydrolase
MISTEAKQSIERIEANAAKMQELRAEVEALLSEPRPRSIGIPRAVLALGVCLGAGVVVLAAWLL